MSSGGFWPGSAATASFWPGWLLEAFALAVKIICLWATMKGNRLVNQLESGFKEL
jgi:hypothetical protein